MTEVLKMLWKPVALILAVLTAILAFVSARANSRAAISKAEAGAAKAQAQTEATKAEMATRDTADAQAEAAAQKYRVDASKEKQNAENQVDSLDADAQRRELFGNTWSAPAARSGLSRTTGEGSDENQDR
ncbi:BcepGomrgp74 [Burkholderia phage BcepGomr]|uniref:BcepGomrgp74 n=1 Tax=Burkholderia phage BcepGomr TaxID=437329 RepID=UPI0001503556|nr:BcepGomrgp74 [Burkholderia phage BcepGomr]ABP63645.1 BcepGomrgp74 [Burkholderia phage BcepGomr]